MARQRTGSAVDAVDESDKSNLAEVVEAPPELANVPKPVAKGELRIFINGQRRDGDKILPAGEYDLPREEAMHFVNTGAARIIAG